MGRLVTKRSNMMVMVAIATTIMQSMMVDASYSSSTIYRPSSSYSPPSYDTGYNTPSYDTPPTSWSGYDPSATWQSAHATFYGDESASETMGGACGYGNLFDSGYGLETTALSSVMFNNGKACGQCFEIKCVDSKWCNPGASPIKVTATNLCPPNWYQDSNAGGWCNPPRSHFDLSKPMFLKIAQAVGGIVPVNYRRVPCVRQGGIRFKIQGNPYWLLVYVMNVGGSGDIAQIWVKGPDTEWISMSNNWGASFQAFSKFGGQPLSFKITNGDGQTIVLNNVTPTYWSTGNTYQGNNNFY